MIANKLRRLGTVGTAVALLALAALAPAASAADTRLVSIGETVDCTATAQDPNGSLTLTPVSAGALSGFSFSWQNCGSQNLSNAILTVGTAVPGTYDHLSDAFTDGTTIADHYSTGGANSDKGCTLNGDATLLTCKYKSIRPGAGGNLSLVLRASSSASSIYAYAAIKIAENTNDGGANEDTFEATGSTAIAAADCDAVQTFLYHGNSSAGTCGVTPGNPQSSSVRQDGLDSGVSLAEQPSGNTCTRGDKTQLGSDVVADIVDDDGSTVFWTITIDLKALNKNSVKPGDVEVCHWNDGGNETPIYNLVVTKTSKGILTVTFETDGNGSGRTYG